MYKFDEDMYIEFLPAAVHKQLIKELNDESAWKCLAQNVSDRLELIGSSWIESLENNENMSTKSPAENLLFQLNTRMCTVGIICMLLEDCNLLEALSVLRHPEPLVIERQPNSNTMNDTIEVAFGKCFKVICEARGLPPPKYTWYHKNTLLPGQNSKELNLMINSIAQQGEYRCKVSQVDCDHLVIDQQLSETVFLKIKPTRIVIEKQPIAFVEVQKGEAFKLDCLVSSHPPPKYQWFRDNTKLEMQTSNVLHIDKFTAKDEGKYYCYITNEVSEAYTKRSNVIVDYPREKAVAKIALLIANEDYDHHEKLRTPKNDVTKLAHILEDIGFKVICLLNLTAKQMRNSMRIFCAALSEGVYGLFYFAGHGFKMQESYMLAVDAPKFYLRSDAVCESELLAMSLPTDPALLVIILDTCQTVPPKECNPEIHKEVPTVNEYRSHKNLRNLIQAYSTSSHRPSYERTTNDCGLYLTHLSKYIVRDIPVQKVFEEVGKSIDVWFKGKERNQIPMFALTVTKPYRLTDAVYKRRPPATITKLNELVAFPGKSVDINFKQTGVQCQAKISQFAKPFLNSIRITVIGADDWTVNFHNSVPTERINLFQNSNVNECRLHNPQCSKGPIVVSLGKNGKPVGAALFQIMDHVPALLHRLDVS